MNWDFRFTWNKKNIAWKCLFIAISLYLYIAVLLDVNWGHIEQIPKPVVPHISKKNLVPAEDGPAGVIPPSTNLFKVIKA